MDLSFFVEGTGPQGVQLPDPAKTEQAKLVLEGLRRQNRLADLSEQDTTRKLAGQDAYYKAIPAIVQSGFDPKVVSQVLQQYPEAAPLIQEAWDKHAARVDTAKKTDAEVYSKKTDNLLKQYSQMAGLMAKEIEKNPNAIPDGQIANFYGKIADNGLAQFMPTLPFKDWSDKGAVAQHLRELGGAFYSVTDQTKDAQNKVKDDDASRRGWFDSNSQDRRRKEETSIGYGNLEVNRGQLKVAQDKANREKTTLSPDLIKMENALADDWGKKSAAFGTVSDGMGRVVAALKTADSNPGSALAAGTAFMKILDANSVVRESELKMALQASGVLDRWRNAWNTTQNGTIMTKTQKANLEAAANDLWDAARAAQLKIDANYRRRATDYNMNPDRIITDYGQNQSYRRPGLDGGGFGANTAAPTAASALMKAPEGSGAEWVYKPGGR